VWDENVQLGPLAGPHTRGGRDVHPGIADRGGHLSKRPRRVLNVDDESTAM
jgi:hypothetical protein